MKKTYAIEVDCANCANLMEEAARKTEGVASAVVIVGPLDLLCHGNPPRCFSPFGNSYRPFGNAARKAVDSRA